MINEFTNLVQNANPWVLTSVILVMFISTLAVVPWLIVRLPFDYFLEEKREHRLLGSRYLAARFFFLIVKNLFGAVLVILGIMMLVLPGQGLLTILIGLVMMDFPGKYRCERWLVCRKPVLKSINWFRHKYDRAPLVFDNPEN